MFASWATALRARHDGRACAEHGRQHAARLAARRMARGDVADLVAQHRRELRLGGQIDEQAAMHVDVAASRW